MLALVTIHEERKDLRDSTCNGVSSNLQFLQGVQMRHAHPRHLIPIHKRHAAHIASVADRDQILETRLPQRQCWNRTCQQPHQTDDFESDIVPQMKRLARPGRADSDEASPRERDQDGSKDNWVRPVRMLAWFEGRCGVGGAGDPFVVETEGDREGDYGYDVEDEYNDAETESVATPAGRDLEV